MSISGEDWIGASISFFVVNLVMGIISYYMNDLLIILSISFILSIILFSVLLTSIKNEH